jgi:two-component system OmpR family response regulator
VATVLLVDDSEDIQRFVRRHVEEAGHRFLGALDGAAGRALAVDGTPDVVLLDWMLPGDDGLALCRDLKREQPGLRRRTRSRLSRPGRTST